MAWRTGHPGSEMGKASVEENMPTSQKHCTAAALLRHFTVCKALATLSLKCTLTHCSLSPGPSRLNVAFTWPEALADPPGRPPATLPRCPPPRTKKRFGKQASEIHTIRGIPFSLRKASHVYRKRHSTSIMNAHTPVTEQHSKGNSE